MIRRVQRHSSDWGAKLVSYMYLMQRRGN